MRACSVLFPGRYLIIVVFLLIVATATSVHPKKNATNRKRKCESNGTYACGSGFSTEDFRAVSGSLQTSKTSFGYFLVRKISLWGLKMLRIGSLEIIFHVSLKINCSPLLETNRSYRPRVKQKSKYYS